MKDNIYIKNIKKHIADGKAYDEYQHLFFEYIDYLKGVLADNPRDVFSLCQLAIAYMEAREPDELSTQLMENALEEFKDELTFEEQHMLLINLAFFYDEENLFSDKPKPLLEEAVMIPSEYPQGYHALGTIYTNKGKYKKAIALFSQAMELDDDIKYRYNYATALYYDGQTEKALNEYSRICKDWRDDEAAEKAYYAYGVIKSLMGDVECGIKVADDMQSSLDSVEIFMGASDIYYVCGQYQCCVETFEQDRIYPMAKPYCRYIYAYNAIHSKQQVLALRDQIINEKDETIEDTLQEEVEEAWTQEDKDEYIQDLEKEKNDLIELFAQVMNEGYKPKMDFKPYLVYGCYLIGCPRHWNF